MAVVHAARVKSAADGPPGSTAKLPIVHSFHTSPPVCLQSQVAEIHVETAASAVPRRRSRAGTTREPVHAQKADPICSGTHNSSPGRLFPPRLSHPAVRRGLDLRISTI